jgi:hypothetical protein
MPLRVSIDDFKLISAVCELRYEEASLLFDRTGQICHEAKSHFTDCEVVSAIPNQTILKTKEGNLVVELKQCRVASTRPDTSLEAFAANCKRFFDSVSNNLMVKAFTRVGLRVVFRKVYPDLEQAKAALNLLKLLNVPEEERFGAASTPREMIFRWEGTQVGAMLRLVAEAGKIDVVFPPELEMEKSEIHKSITGLLLDVDYYTIAPVERSQWDAAAWIPRSLRTIKKQSNAVIGN